MSQTKYYLDYYVCSDTSRVRTSINHHVAENHEQAVQILKEHGIPAGIVVFGPFVQDDGKATSGLYSVGRYFSALRDHMEHLNRTQGFTLDEPIAFEWACEVQGMSGAIQQENQDRASSFQKDVEFLNSHYSLKNSRTRWHQSVMKAMGKGFESFMRTGRWGSCADCPELHIRHDHYVTMTEMCPNTDRYDHQLDLNSLVEQYAVRMKQVSHGKYKG